MSVVAIDQGTTSTRALVIDRSGERKITQIVAHQQCYPKPGWVEHHPEELIRHIQLCVDSCHDVAAIGFANQGESCLAWDAQTKEAISPVIVWQDNRTHKIIKKLRSDGAQNLVTEKSGLPLDTYFSASKLGWIVENIPAAEILYRRGKLRLGTTDAFFLDRFANQFVTDITTASRTSLLNLQSGQWDSELCDLFGVPIDALPDIVASTGDFGALKSNGKFIPITASIVDQQASLYGHGCRTLGDAKITFGTGAFALVVTGNRPYRSPAHGLLPTVAWQLLNQTPTYALDGGVYCAGSALNWARSLGLFESFDQLNQFSQPPAIKRNLVFVPALSGMACPHWDRQAAGLWIGLSLDTQSMDMMQSMLEGIVFRIAEVVSTMNDFTPVEKTISIDGGLSANPYFCQFLANVLNMQVIAKQFSELTAYGTAQLAAGDRIVQRFIHKPGIRYYPNENMSQYMDRFQQAISRSTKWLS